MINLKFEYKALLQRNVYDAWYILVPPYVIIVFKLECGLPVFLFLLDKLCKNPLLNNMLLIQFDSLLEID